VILKNVIFVPKKTSQTTHKKHARNKPENPRPLFQLQNTKTQSSTFNVALTIKLQTIRNLQPPTINKQEHPGAPTHKTNAAKSSLFFGLIKTREKTFFVLQLLRPPRTLIVVNAIKFDYDDSGKHRI
jgi:hypothetical protein